MYLEKILSFLLFRPLIILEYFINSYYRLITHDHKICIQCGNDLM